MEESNVGTRNTKYERSETFGEKLLISYQRLKLFKKCMPFIVKKSPCFKHLLSNLIKNNSHYLLLHIPVPIKDWNVLSPVTVACSFLWLDSLPGG